MGEELGMDLFSTELEDFNIEEFENEGETIEDPELGQEEPTEGGEENTGGGEGDFTEDPEGKIENVGEEKGVDNSPRSDIYKTLTEALVEDGVLPDISEDEISDVKTAEEFSQIIEKQIQSRFDEAQKRIYEALNNNVEVNEIKKFENTISFLDSITEDKIEDESDAGEDLRKRLIYSDFINKGFSAQRAQREVEKSIKSGNDIEDAKEALESNREHFNNEYKSIIEEQKRIVNEQRILRENAAKELDKLILDTDEPFDGLKLNNTIKKKISDNIKKPIHKDEDGRSYNAIQKYAKENPVDFNYKVGLLYTMTNGFKDLSALNKQIVAKEKKKTVSALERKLSNMSFTPSGEIDLEFGNNDSEAVMLAI